jgi:hypothetical protein
LDGEVKMKEKAYYYKWKFLWISWVLEIRSEPTVLYADNVKSLVIESDHIGYFHLSLSKKRAVKKLKEFCIRRYS